MPQAAQFWQYAEEAMLSARQSKSEMEKMGLMDLARAWAQPAVQSETAVAVNDCPPETTAAGDARGDPANTLSAAHSRAAPSNDQERGLSLSGGDGSCSGLFSRGSLGDECTGSRSGRGFSTGGLAGSANCGRWGMRGPGAGWGKPAKTTKFRLPVWRYGTGEEQARCLEGASGRTFTGTEGILSTRAFDARSMEEQKEMAGAPSQSLPLSLFGGGMMMFYSLFSSPSTTVTTGYSPIVDDFRSLEASRPGPAPPTTVGQGGSRIAN